MNDNQTPDINKVRSDQQQAASGGGLPPKPPSNAKRNGLLVLLGLALCALAVFGGWFYLNGAGKQAAAPVEPSGSTAPGQWRYPSQDAFWSIGIDDFNLCMDGTVRITVGISDVNDGLSVGFLEDCVKLDPPAPFTVEQLSPKEFLLRIEGGRTLPQTRLVITGSGDNLFDTMIEARLNVRIATDPAGSDQAIDAPIRVEFSDLLPELPDAQSLVTIDPPIEFTASVKDNFLILTPAKRLDYATQYRVIVTALTSQGGFVMQQDAELYLATELRDFSLVMTNRGVNTVRPGEKIRLEYQLDTVAQKGKEVTVALYALPGFDAYYNLLNNLETADLAGLPLVGKPITEKMKEGLNELSFSSPKSGYCLVRTAAKDTKTGEDVVDFKPIQVSTASLYFQAAKGQMLLWLNDAASGQPLSGYTVSFAKDGAEVASVVTGADGSVLSNYSVPKPEQEREPYYGKGQPPLATSTFTVRDPAGTPIYADCTASLQPQEEYDKIQDRYYSFFYIDRALYRPTDTVHFWGYVKPYLLNRADAPHAILVTFDPGGLDQKLEVPVKADGTFSGEFSYEQIATAGYEVRAEMMVSPYADPYGGGERNTRTLQSYWIDVKEFTTPAYSIASAVDNILYRYGDEVQVTVTPTFFDGTPLPNYPLEFSLFNPYTGNFEETVNLTTDAKGVAHTSFSAGATISGKDLSWTPKTGYYYVKIANDGENITYQGTYTFLPADVMIRPSMQVSRNGDAKLTVLANKITTERITSAEQVAELVDGYYSFDGYSSKKYDILVGEPADIDLNVALSHTYVEPVDHTWKNGKEYKTLKVVKGKGALAGLTEQFTFVKDAYLALTANVSYSVNNNTISGSASGSNGYDGWQDDQVKREAVKGYTFNVYKNGSATPAQTYEQYMSQNYLTADLGDRLRFELSKDGVPVKEPRGKILYTLLQDELIERGTGVNDFALTQKQSYAGNVMVVAAYFDGKEVWPVRNCSLMMNQESLALNIEATTDREAYKPGEEVTIKVKTKDAKGSPIASRLCISVVDEAVFALQEQYFDLLSQLYGNMDFFNSFIYKYATSVGDVSLYNNGGDGGKGDGADMAAYDSFRKNFKDTACFYPTTSDSQGNAAVTFTLPDNITSWRITTVAVGSNLSGGSSKENFVTTLPFFVKPVISPKYIDGDEVAMLLQGHGTAVKSGDQMDYSVRLTGDGIDKTYTAKGAAYEAVQLNLGRLPEGDYTVTSTGELGGNRDTVQLPLSVIHSNLELVVSQKLNPRQPVKIDALRYPVVITLYDEAYEPYYKSIGSLLTHYCFRIDQRMSRFAAKRALMQHCTPEEIPQHLKTSDSDIAGFQNQDGGIGWYVGGESDPVVTFKVLLFAGDQFSSTRMQHYFTAIVADSDKTATEHAAARAGLAILDKTQTAKLQELLALTAPAPTYEESLYYLAGLSYAGDLTAKALYGELVTPKLKSHREEAHLEYSTAAKTYNRQAEDDTATALAWLSASKLGLEDADAYAAYFSQGEWRISSIFECMAYVTNFAKPLSGPASFSYLSGGETKQIDLGVTGSKTLTLNRSQMEGLAFQEVPETVTALAYYIGEPEEAGILPSDTLKISKEFTPMEGGKYKVNLKIDFAPEASYGYYNISDWIPSNMRLYNVAQQPQSSKLWIQHTQENQKMYFEFYRNENTPATVNIEYLVQRTFDAEAVADRTYIICADSGENAFTERTTIQ